MATYSTSDGQRLTKSQIKSRTDKAVVEYREDFVDEHGYQYCEHTEISNQKLDVSHIISVKYAQETGRAELAWDKRTNMELLIRAQHMKLESLGNLKREVWYNMRQLGYSFEEFLKSL
jgi:hypothetical protein